MVESCSAAAQASYSGVVWVKTGGAVGVGSIWGVGAGDGRRKSGRPSGIVEPRRSIAEVVTSEARSLEKALERRTRRTHGRPCDNPAGADWYLSG